jgi:hypothetical protein
MGRQLTIAARGSESRQSFYPSLAARRNVHV